MNEFEKRSKIDTELSELNQNRAAIQAQSDQKMRERREAKKYWGDELNRNDQQRNMEKDAEGVLKKPVAI